jgi:hypothetical protein
MLPLLQAFIPPDRDRRRPSLSARLYPLAGLEIEKQHRNAENAENAEKKSKQEEETAFDGDYMDYRITWIKKQIYVFIHVIL